MQRALPDWRVVLAVFLFACMAQPSAVAEDIDIYTRPVSTGGPGGAPVVMFVLDSSGSMAWSIDDNNNAAHLLKQRLFLLQDAAYGQLTAMSGNYKVGIARYEANVTGKVISEARPLAEGAAAALNGTTTFAISSGEDDVEQAAGKALRGGETVLGLGRESISGTLTAQRVGLRFPDVVIPAGAVISKAWLQFRSAGANSEATVLVAGMDTDAEPRPFSASDDLFSRTFSWGDKQEVAGWASGADNTSTRLDVTALLQGRVNGASWCGRGDTVFVVEGASATDLRRARSFESGYTPPRLMVEWTLAPGEMTCREHVYDVSTMSDDVYEQADGKIINADKFVGASSSSTAGLRFGLVDIPPGAVIEDARLEVIAHQTTTAHPLQVQAIAEPLARPFSSKVSSLTQRSRHAAVVDWAPAGWAAGNRYTSPDLSVLVQQVIDSPGWEYDGALALVVRGTTATELRIRAWERTSDDSNTTTLSKFGTYSARLRIRARAPYEGRLTHRRQSVQTVRGMVANGGTPIAGAYLVAANYLLGRVSGLPQPALVAGECGSNTLVLLTDGAEQAYKYSTSQFPADVKELTDKNCAVTSGGSTDWNRAWGCSNNIARSMYEPEQTGVTARAADGNYYSVKTYTIGFGPIAKQGGGDLNAVAVQGGGDYFPATDSAALIDVFEQIVSSVVSAGTAVAAPGAAVNALNRYEHLDELYYSLFKPSTTVNWRGNVKRYRLKDGAIVDVTGADAIDSEESVFASTAQSWWSSGTDGADITGGGVAEELPPESRRLYTWLGSYGTSMAEPLYADPASGAARDGSGAEVVLLDNANISEELLGVDQVPDYAGMNAAERVALRNQALTMLRGGTNDVPEKGVGAALHASPLLVSFGVDDKGNDDPDDDELVNTVFVGDSTGVLRMIDTGGASSDDELVNKANAGGGELFAFIPQELLGNAATIKQNTQKIGSLGGAYVHGLDGQWSVWRNDSDRDGKIDVDADEHVYIYGGMRRGGRNVYALDVSQVHRQSTMPQPQLLWVIEGGVTGPYANMGQTWSTPKSYWVKWNGERRRVVIFGGGYDADIHDDDQLYSAELNNGRQVYMVDAATGELLWWASSETGASTLVPAMRHSITAAPVVMDRNGNGMIDGMYVVDLGGQVFRFDFDESAAAADEFVRNGDPVLVATLGATAGFADASLDNRRFYDAPAVTYVRSAQGGDLLIGGVSGYREAPVDTATQEIAFVLRDRGAWALAPPASATPRTLDDLVDVTAVDALDPVAAGNGNGWYIALDKDKGEKGMGTPTFFNFAMLFTTYVPYGSTTVSECLPDIGRSRLYALNALTAGGLVNDDLEHVAINQRHLDHVVPGIAPAPQLLLVGGVLTAFTGPSAILTSVLERDESNQLSAEALNGIDRTRWYQVRE
ncbi:MAG: pilus assembly protein [Gammaproteobacteria bacterium]